MSAASDYLEGKIGSLVFGGVSFTPPATVYIALHTGDPGETGASSEVSGNGYARKAVTNNTTNFATVSGARKNQVAIIFPTSTPGAWGTITHASVWDAASGGNCLAKGALAASKAVGIGDSIVFDVNSLALTVD